MSSPQPEQSIAELHAAMLNGTLTCSGLVHVSGQCPNHTKPLHAAMPPDLEHCTCLSLLCVSCVSPWRFHDMTLQGFLRRIAQLDKSHDDQVINSIRIVNPAVLDEAAARDAEVCRCARHTRQPNSDGGCLPVHLVKLPCLTLRCVYCCS